MVVRNHLLKGYQCYSCGHNLSKIENINTSFALQLGLRSGDNRLALRPEFNNILKHHVQCEKCKLIICKSCLQNKKPKMIGITDHTALNVDLTCFISRFY